MVENKNSITLNIYFYEHRSAEAGHNTKLLNKGFILVLLKHRGKIERRNNIISGGRRLESLKRSQDII